MASLTRVNSEEENTPSTFAPINDDKFFEMVLEMGDKPLQEIDDMDYQFLTDFSIINVTFTVYEQLQANTFFDRKDKPRTPNGDPDGTPNDPNDPDDNVISLHEFETKGKFRLCQLYPVVLRATLGYYAHIGKSYYDSTIKTRRFNQVPIGLNDKAYAIVCIAIKRLVIAQLNKEQKTEKMMMVKEGKEDEEEQEQVQEQEQKEMKKFEV